MCAGGGGLLVNLIDSGVARKATLRDGAPPLFGFVLIGGDRNSRNFGAASIRKGVIYLSVRVPASVSNT